MRRLTLTACLLALMLTGCASRQAQLLPPGTDRDELTATIAARGQDTSPDNGPPLPDESRAGRFVTEFVKAAAYPVYFSLMVLYGLCEAGGPR